jgi:hypothetical protein
MPVSQQANQISMLQQAMQQMQAQQMLQRLLSQMPQQHSPQGPGQGQGLAPGIMSMLKGPMGQPGPALGQQPQTLGVNQPIPMQMPNPDPQGQQQQPPIDPQALSGAGPQ